MRPGPEWRKFLFNHRKHFFDRGPLRLPCEMKRHGRATVTRAHPKVVCCNRTELCDEKVWRNLVAKLLNGKYCRIAFIARNEVLRLQLGAAAWRKVHAKVWKPLVPGSGNAHLLGTILGRMPGKRMQVVGGGFGAVEICLRICVRGLINATFDPHLRRSVVLPVCEDTDAIPARKDIVQVMFKLRE